MGRLLARNRPWKRPGTPTPGRKARPCSECKVPSPAPQHRQALRAALRPKTELRHAAVSRTTAPEGTAGGAPSRDGAETSCCLPHHSTRRVPQAVLCSETELRQQLQLSEHCASPTRHLTAS